MLSTLPDILPQFAFIRESECIGCTKCIQACPVDAIMGAAKQMHTILKTVCIGCGLCLPPCPVDCIDLLPTATPSLEEKQQKSALAHAHFERHQTRLAQNKTAKKPSPANKNPKITAISFDEIEAAITRVTTKRLNKNACKRKTD